MRRRTFLAAGALPFWRAAHARGATPRVTSRIVDRLRPISQERRAALERNPERRTTDALGRLIPEIDDIEVWNASSAPPRRTLRVLAWNMERGRHWKDGVRLIRETEALRDPDIILLGEMDLGMARSGDVHTTREMAARLGMNYAYGVEFLELTGGELGERELYPGPNEWGYHGNAILSRYPLRDVRMLRFPGIEKWYDGKTYGANESEQVQKRLGGRMALFATVQPGRDVTLVSTHLESSARDTAMRNIQTVLLLDELRAYAKDTPVILGGDLNAGTEEPMFEAVRAAGFLPEDSNDLATPTRQRIEDGRIVVMENHIDYLLVRGARVVRDATSPKVVPAVYPPGANAPGSMLGDHAIVTAKVEL
jgi:endonuclease/exonuclease/phosphatase family metal-dependent hydrolase